MNETIYIHEYSTALDSESDSESVLNLIPVLILRLCRIRFRNSTGIKFRTDSDSESIAVEYSCMYISYDVIIHE